MTTAVKRACDGCHRRKVKCDSGITCRNCATAGIECTYLAIPQKKGPKGSRAKVITELRDNQRQASLAAKVHNRLHGTAVDVTIPALNPTAGMLSNDLIKACVQYYFDNAYSTLPFLDRAQIEQMMQNMENGRDRYCLFAALCAYVVLQPGMTLPASSAEETYNISQLPGANITASVLLLEECLRVRKGSEYYETPNFNILVTNVFIYACIKIIDGADRAWYYLREASTMALTANLDKEETYSQFPTAESVRRRRLFWFLFASERVYFFDRRRPLSLYATIAPSQMHDDPQDAMYPDIHSFFIMCNIFRPMDEVFLAAWRNGCDHLDVHQTSLLKRQLREWQAANPFHAESTYLANQQFLNNTLWQLNNNNSQYQVDLTQRLTSKMATSFAGQPLELAKSCLFPKLLEICLNLTTFLANVAPDRHPLAVGPHQWLQDILDSLDPARNGDFAYTPLLLAKVNEILPRLADPLLRNAPESASFSMSADIFDGFGNAGMASMPPMNEYNQGMIVDESETKYDMSGSSPDTIPNSNYSNGTPPGTQPGSDMTSAFAGSPANVMSPGIDYNVGNVNMGGFDMPEMGMNSFTGAQPNPMNNMQHQQRIGSQPPMQSMQNQNVSNPAMNPSINQIYGIQQPQRQNSYQMQNQPALSQMGSMPEMDFPMR
ncbi:transcription activator amyR [Fusarium beomiforme]|uniref:Transcription activator amyR n=1 Tax=Fusarium beomiforme TaxID=44412 RepID=A0A9P5AV65_9HYPO|nr:transcription activator amyR [Fusarium beomiforme]